MSLVDAIKKHPIASYFILAFTISWTLAFLVVAREVLSAQPIPYFSGIIMFPAMLVGPFVSGLVLTRIVEGKEGLKALFARERTWRLGRWYVPAIFIPPALILTTLFLLTALISSVYAPNVFAFGFGFGIVAGFMEEIGWTGYAIRKLTAKYDALSSAVILGGIWGLWHAPVVDFLGAAYPHGAYWFPFYLSFIAVIMAVRVLIVWLYSNTHSLLIAQVLHASSTGFLATLAPITVMPAQEAGWYATYALLLWIVVAAVAKRYGRSLRAGSTAATPAANRATKSLSSFQSILTK